ncbi:hypothetical protein CSB62_23665 [Vibrio splendidus]|uniref:EscD/YscD/HrpQ family type III secretion system inner membrane ring protein n=3 Tax=Vibrio lentus TaxID=136468 RepID=A0A855IST3_9VIBR|nr:FHA domain-containing protein [Vibrio lentus]PHN83496.1 hypothetical protein CSB62_23665 [Vibrio splendidus]MCB5361988.1 hypothetical protein [Vibrio lentus]MCB5452323.1 hypothetical protein [Vibrio lentus]MCB5464355.1 hypothetical protein [Vibrio lentus]MCB5464532.1 hypothetical protein [Vibrio lentus]
MLELRVLNGVHKGAILPLLEDTITIGSSETCDLAVYESGIEPIHLTLRFDGKACALVHQNGYVLDITNAAIDIGQIMLPNSPFRIGRTWFVYTDSDEAWLDENGPTPKSDIAEQGTKVPPAIAHNVKGRSRKWILASMAVLVLLFGGIMTALLPARSDELSIIEIKPSIPELDATGVMKQLSEMLEERGLKSMINVELRNEMNVAIRGRLDLTSSEVLNRMLRRFKRTFITQVRIDDQVIVTEHGLPFEVNTIVVGKTPHVVTNTQDIIFLGDEKEGYRLVDINEDRVIFDGVSRVEVAW